VYSLHYMRLLTWLMQLVICLFVQPVLFMLTQLVPFFPRSLNKMTEKLPTLPPYLYSWLGVYQSRSPHAVINQWICRLPFACLFVPFRWRMIGMSSNCLESSSVVSVNFRGRITVSNRSITVHYSQYGLFLGRERRVAQYSMLLNYFSSIGIN